MIRIVNISHSFIEQNGNHRHDVLKDINIDIQSGEFVTLFGPSGSGKSTLVNLIAGYLNIQSGSIAINGKVYTEPGKNRVVVNQEHDLFDWLTVEQNLRLISSDEKLMETYLSLVRLQKFRSYYPSKLSGGMKKRVALIRALLVQPKILVLDEPFASLDTRMKEELQSELDKIVSLTGTTTILVTHDLDEAVFLSDRIIVLGKHPTSVIGETRIPNTHPRIIGYKRSKSFTTLKQKVIKILSK